MYKTAIPIYRKCKNMTRGIEFRDKLVKMNNLTATQKLEYALQMAESIAVLNNFEKGVIVHDDVQLTQFLLAPNGKLKLVRICAALAFSHTEVSSHFHFWKPLLMHIVQKKE
jgi:hypothetical protein